MHDEHCDLDDNDRFPMGPLHIDIKALYDRMPIAKEHSPSLGYVPEFQDAFHRYVYHRSQIPLHLRVRAKNLFRRTNLDDRWLAHFEEYWVRLGGRPLWHVSDFFFLRTFYRLRTPPSDQRTLETASDHLNVWQNQGFIYGLFQAVLKETFASEYECLRLLRSLKPRWSSLLEYGAGSAPITSSIVQYNRWHSGCKCLIADLPTLTFHYAAHKFRHCPSVETVLLRPEDEFQLVTDRQFDVVFCREVFEHLNRPLDTAHRLVRLLKPGGLLFFDYITSEARGLDSFQGLAERDSVLDYLASAGRVEYGAIRKDRHVGLTVLRKLG